MGVVTNIGLEIEFSKVPQRVISDVIRNRRMRASVVNDASCTKHTYMIGDFELTNDGNVVNDYVRDYAKYIQTGGEIVTGVINTTSATEDWRGDVTTLLSTLRDNGEVPGLTTGIHLHISFGRQDFVPIEALLAVTELWARLEAIIFRLTQGELGYSRGSKQLDYLYYRPIVPVNGPAVVRDRGGTYRPNHQLTKLLNARTTDEFFQSLSRSDQAGGRYWVAKYHALNFYPVCRQGTLELRTPNYTNNPEYVFAWVELLKRIVGKAYGAFVSRPVDYDRPYLPLGYKGDTDLQDLVDILDLHDDDKLVNTLEELWSISSWADPVQGYLYSHLGHGLGRRMPESIVSWDGIREDLVPDKLDRRSVKVHRPEEYVGDNNIDALRDVPTPRREVPRRGGTTTMRGTLDAEAIRRMQELTNATTVRIQDFTRETPRTEPLWTFNAPLEEDDED